MDTTQVALIILDGWGYREDTKDNAVADAQTPVFDELWAHNPHTLLEASGEAVGLPEGQMGNSEIGHSTIGAGTIIDTDLVRINKAIRTNQFGQNPVFQELFAHVEENHSTLHVLGLVSSGGIHSHHDHLVAFVRAAKEAGITKLAIHAFTDGRDTPPRSAADYLEALEAALAETGLGQIATVSGRFYAMDRDKNWDRLEHVEHALFDAKAGQTETRKPSEVIREQYTEHEALDEHLKPIVFLDRGINYTIQPGDGIFLFNYRPDRVQMITQKLVERTADQNVYIATMTEYASTLPVHVAYPQPRVSTTLAAEISKAGLTQQHVAETEKFPHATFFLNGGRETPHEQEEHVLLPSRKDVQTHDEAPEMRAEGIANEAIKRIEAGVNFTFINFANPDMVGHTANHPAIVQALEVVDHELGRVLEAVRSRGGVLFITADHGNAEVTVDQETGEKHTSHTLNKVPAILVGDSHEMREGTLADITPTLLELFGIQKPESMSGSSLFV